MSYTKTITPAYGQIGKRRRLTGYLGEVFDGDTLLHAQEYANHSEAERKTDELAYELLSDGAQADDDDTPIPGPDHGDDIDAPPDRPRCESCGDLATMIVAYDDTEHTVCDACHEWGVQPLLVSHNRKSARR